MGLTALTTTSASRAGSAVRRDVLVTEHLALVRQLATRYAGRNEPLEDLVQAGCIGLIKAANGFDPERGAAFPAYAAKHIIGEMRRHFRDHGWCVHTPRRIQELHLRLGPLIEELTQRLGRQPSIAEIAEEADEPADAVRQALAAGNAYRAAPLDVTGERGDATASLLGKEEAELEQLLDRSMLQPGLRALPERERLLLWLRYVDGLTQTEIAARIGVSQVHVSRLLNRTLGTLRSSMAA